ncbi:ArsR/SmtB family transcription factor [Nonomuraea sp. bgisy101]|uniref:ArsR/SmtB family transcription factor n=1 Tax=Nonomuraea sp. bgisy101 TaxID=3413784 RepID=UPI003D7111D9
MTVSCASPLANPPEALAAPADGAGEEKRAGGRDGAGDADTGPQRARSQRQQRRADQRRQDRACRPAHPGDTGVGALQFPGRQRILARRLSMAPGAVSQHLKVLRENGLITKRRSGREVFYERSQLGDTLCAAS